MRRAPSWRPRRLPLAILFLALTATAAVAKPKVAVLGLEVTGTVDQATTTAARELTEGLRARAKAADGPYALAPNSDRELIDEKLIKSCDDEAPACMAEIGRDIGTDMLVYGSLAKAPGGHKLTLRVLDVKKAALIDTKVVSVPASATGDAARTFARDVYVQLVGGAAPPPPAEVPPGTLEVRSSAPGARVFVDDEAKDALTGGRTVLTLPEGRYRIAVEAPGFRRKEVTVQIRPGASAGELFELEAEAPIGGGPAKEGGGMNIWKPVFGVALVATIGLAAYSGYAYTQMTSAADNFQGTRIDGSAGDITEADCDNVAGVMQAPGTNYLQEACDNQKAHKITAIAAIGGVVLTGVAGYLAFGRSSGSEAPRTAARAPRRRDLVVTPTVSAQGAGASLSLRW